MLKRELKIFIIVGLLTVAIDFLIYRGSLRLGIDSISLAKTTGFIGVTIFSYFANRFWTFANPKTQSGSLLRFILVYLIGLLANVLVNKLALDAGEDAHLPLALYLAFILATVISAALNFIGMKYFVFTKQPTGSI